MTIARILPEASFFFQIIHPVRAAGGVILLSNNPSGQDRRRYLFAKVGRELVHEPQGLSTSAKKVAAVDFLYSCLLGKKISPAA
ncbi:hypothetical protein JW933_10930, partial [candidate division FCPU426 bacterium]|nr:hypothetical protein [candidate division FCPU426 bacterium]